MATTARDMNTLCDRLDTLVDRLTEEYNVELPQERTDAKGDATLLAAIDRRGGDLKVALKIHKDAKAAYLLAKAAYKVNPTEMDTNYAKALGLAAQLEAVVDFRKTDGSDTSKTDPKTDSDKEKAKGDGKDKKEPEGDADKAKDGKGDKPKGKPDSDSKDDSDKEKAKGKDKGDKPEPATDPILAAIEGLRADCAQNHTAALDAITALEPRLIKPELAKIINGRTPEQLAAALNGQGVTPDQAAFLTAIMARFTADDIIALLDIKDAGVMDRFRFAFGGNGAHR